MNRHYTAEEYYDLCQKLREKFADCTLTTDIMVGFSGETEEDFNDTVKFAEKVGFEKIHIFPYSVREGTRAASFDGKIEKAVKEQRVAELSRVAEKIRSKFLKKQIGRTVEIIPETKRDGDFVFGYTANYTPVLAKLSDFDVGTPVSVKITSSDSEHCYAE